MAVNLITGNLNILGNNGQFETDRSTWGFVNVDGVFTASRVWPTDGSLLKNFACSANLSARATSGDVRFITGKLSSTINYNKKYLARCWVYVPDFAVPFAGTETISIGVNATSSVTVIDQTNFTIAQATNTWRLLELKFTNPVFNDISAGFLLHLIITGANGSAGIVELDGFEIYEYEDVCDLAIDTGSTIIVNESAAAASDGSITVAITGGTAPYEYSINGTDWQSSNVFSGLTTGQYTIYVRDDGGCTDQEIFNINVAQNFDFTTTVTHESISGSADGEIVVNVTGDGAPFTYSKDGGSNYQAGNTFSDLAAGAYNIAVKDTYDNVLIKLVSVDPGIQIFSKIYFSENPIPFTAQATANVSEDNYKIYLGVDVEDENGSGIYNRKLTVVKEPLNFVQGENINFNLRQAFRGIFSFAPPAFNGNNMEIIKDRVKLYKVRHGDIYDLLTVPAALNETDPFLVIYGGISKRKYPDVDYFYDLVPNDKKFMTWSADSKLVDYLQEDYMNFFVYAPLTTKLKLMVKYIYSDGTDSGDVNLSEINVGYADLVLIPSGCLNVFSLSLDTAKTLRSYELWLTDQDDNVYSEVRTFRVNMYKHVNTRYYLFMNSLGAYEVIRTTGRSIERADYERVIIQKFLPVDYDSLDGELESGDNFKQNYQEANSGMMGGKNGIYDLEYFQEFLLSKKVFDITNSTRIPVIIDTGSSDVRTIGNRRQVSFKVVNAYRDKVFTPADI